MMPALPAAGFFGKIPSRGDFIRRGLSSSLIDVWEAWVGQAIGASRALLGDGWDEAWMVAPVWRFTLADGVCGTAPVLGLMMPSVDRVGRLYPLMIAVELTGQTGMPDPDEGLAFLDLAEDAGRDALADELEPDTLWERLRSATYPVTCGAAGRSVWWTEGSGSVAANTVVLDGMPPMPDHAAMLAGETRPGGACR